VDGHGVEEGVAGEFGEDGAEGEGGFVLAEEVEGELEPD